MPEFLDLETIFIIVHIFGAILGAGGAFASDAIFLTSVRDGVINDTEMRFIKLGSRLVWAGLALLILSGACLVYLSPGYLDSAKFLAKMSVVLVIFLNGVAFHVFHIPVFKRNINVPIATSPEWRKRGGLIMVSGAISMTSWISAVVLGMLHGVPYTYGQITGVYFILLLVAISSALILKKKLLRI